MAITYGQSSYSSNDNDAAADYYSQGGDSGSPIYTGSKLVGIHEGTNGGSTKAYTQIENL
ncbi:hypothetical protein ACNRWW_02040 [Metabacillus sp. HB246100]